MSDLFRGLGGPSFQKAGGASGTPQAKPLEGGINLGAPQQGPAGDTVQFSRTAPLGNNQPPQGATASLVANVGKMSLADASKQLNPNTFAGLTKASQDASDVFPPIAEKNS